MNKIFKIVFNKNTGEFNVTSELSKACGQSKSEIKNDIGITSDVVHINKVKKISTIVSLLFLTVASQNAYATFTLDPTFQPTTYVVDADSDRNVVTNVKPNVLTPSTTLHFSLLHSNGNEIKDITTFNPLNTKEDFYVLNSNYNNINRMSNSEIISSNDNKINTSFANYLNNAKILDSHNNKINRLVTNNNHDIDISQVSNSNIYSYFNSNDTLSENYALLNNVTIANRLKTDLPSVETDKKVSVTTTTDSIFYEYNNLNVSNSHNFKNSHINGNNNLGVSLTANWFNDFYGKNNVGHSLTANGVNNVEVQYDKKLTSATPKKFDTNLDFVSDSKLNRISVDKNDGIDLNFVHNLTLDKNTGLPSLNFISNSKIIGQNISEFANLNFNNGLEITNPSNISANTQMVKESYESNINFNNNLKITADITTPFEVGQNINSDGLNNVIYFTNNSQVVQNTDGKPNNFHNNIITGEEITIDNASYNNTIGGKGSNYQNISNSNISAFNSSGSNIEMSNIVGNSFSGDSLSNVDVYGKWNNIDYSNDSTLMGLSNYTYNINNTFAAGMGNQISNLNDTLFIGNNTNVADYSGNNNSNNVIIGSDTAIYDTGSNNVLIGHNTYLSDTPLDAKAYLTNESFLGEVNFGAYDNGGMSFSESASFDRRLTGVEGGANDNDAVNIAQLKELERLIGEGTTNDLHVFYTDTNKNVVDLDKENKNQKVVMTNVKNGLINETSKDLINGSQFDNISQGLSTIIGGGVKSQDGILSEGFVVNQTQYDTISEAIEAEFNKYHTIVNSTDSIISTKKDNNYGLSLNKDLSASTINVANNNSLTSDKLIINNTEIINANGINANNKDFFNVADGLINSTSKDGINGSQIHDSATSIRNIMSGGIVTDNGIENNNSYILNGNEYQNLKIAVESELKNRHASLSGDVNIGVVKDATDNSYTVSSNNDLVLNSVNFGNSTLNNQGLTFDSGVNITSNNGFDLNNQKATNLADAIINENSLDAITGKQMNERNQSFVSILGTTTHDNNVISGPFQINNHNYTSLVEAVNAESQTNHKKVISGKNTQVAYNDLTNDYSVKLTDNVDINSVKLVDKADTSKFLNFYEGGMVTSSGIEFNKNNINANNTYITSVSDGLISPISKDAINVGQLNNTVSSVKDIFGGNVTISDENEIKPPFVINGVGYDSIVSAIEAQDINIDVESKLTTVKDGNNISSSYDKTNETYTIAMNKDLVTKSFDVVGTQIDETGITTSNGVSINKNNIDLNNQKMINVADATISSTSQDQVTGKNIYHISETTKNIIDDNLVNNNGELTGSIMINDKEYATLVDAITDSFKKNHNSISTKDTNIVLNHNTVDSSYDVAINRNLDLNSIEFNNNSILNQNGYKTNGDTSFTIAGLDSGNNRIEHVANPIDDFDAVNFKFMNDEIAKLTGSSFGEWTYSAQNGDKHKVKTGQNLDFSNKDKNVQIKFAKDGSGINLDLSNKINVGDKVKLDSTTTNISINDEVNLSHNGLEFKDGVKINKEGIDLSHNKITDIADGEISSTSLDAISGKQLHTLEKSIADILGPDITYNPNAAQKYVGENIGGTNQNNISDAILYINNKSNKSNNVSGENMINVSSVINGTGGKTNTVSMADDVTFDSVKVGSIELTKDGINMNDSKIVNLANGEIKEHGKDAATGGQLWDLYQKIKNEGNGVINFTADDGKTYSESTVNINGGSNINTNITENNTIVVNLDDNINVNSINVKQDLEVEKGSDIDMGNNRVKHIGNAVAVTDLVSKGQLDTIENSMKNRGNEIEDKIKSGVAAALAMESAPYVNNALTYSVNLSHFGGANAIGATLRRTSDNGKWSFTGGVSSSTDGNTAVKVGFSSFFN